MTLVKWQPTQSLVSDFDQMISSIFNDGWNDLTTKQTHSIPVDISEDEKEYILSADFPGFDKKDVKLKVEDDQLRLTADKEEQKQSNDGSYRLRERNSGKMSRSFTLPDNVINQEISAKFKNGTLIINIPKAEEVKPNSHQIKIS
ncbi:MAG: Hsp20/alpha crystallin family protein [Fidelibacterota bacterium]|jgi:HSP20 family protein|nr:Hsp20/alpha crystallin family protein [Candidatus Neomarinimicrobiota bacterium]|tara:strand:- start:1506 stop:1940 length:435 start_codon:yes stop_codon:yes gene_type:complete